MGSQIRAIHSANERLKDALNEALPFLHENSKLFGQTPRLNIASTGEMLTEMES